jgi:hypothetical protein
MTAAQFEDLRVDEAAEVLAWRFPPALAARILL